MPRVAFRNFTGGEVTPTLSARYDLKKFGSFLQVCRNFIPNLHGDIERRPGFRWVDTIPTDKRPDKTGDPCGAILVPFMFNTEPENNYVLLFRFDGWITVAGCKCDEYGQDVKPIEYVPLGCAEMHHNYVPPYELYELSYAQVGDILYIAHPNHSLMKLERSDEYPYAWSFTPVAINQSLPKPGAPSVTWVKGNPDDNAETNYELNYVVSAVGKDGVESLPSEVGKCTGKYPTDWVVGNHTELSWAPVPGAVQYNVYREAAGYFGFIATVDQPTEGNVRFQDNNIEPDTAITPKEDWNPFKETVNGVDKANNPATVCFHHQRMWLGGGSLHPATLYASRTGDFESFRKSRPLQDDDPLEFMLASGSIDDVKWLASFDQLLVGTAGSEYKASSSGAAITPSDCQVTAQSYWGSSSLQPILVGQSILHTQRANQHVRDLYYTWEADSYTGNDLSILAPQLVEGHKLLQWAFQQSESCLWIVRDDGTLLCLTYMKEQNVFGWSVHQVGDNGKVISVAAINGEAEDVVFIVVQRGDVYTLERLERKFSDQDGIEDSFYLDCARTFTGSNLTSISGTETITQTWQTAEVQTSSSSSPSEPPENSGSGGSSQGGGGSSSGGESGGGGGTSGDSQAPGAPMSDFYGFELSYAEICMFLDASSASSLVSGTGYVACTAARPSVDVDGYELTSWASGTATTTSPVSVWGENRELLQLLSITGTSFSVNSDGGMDIHPGDIVRIGSEILCVKSVTGAPNSTYSISVKRGCADTLPERHSKGDAVWFYQSGAEVDPVVRDTGQRVYMTAAPMADGAETGGAAASTQIWLTGRGAAPYPPAGVKINSQYWPTRVSGTINVTWVGRDRTALEDNLVDFYDRTVDTTETGVTYQYQLVRVISSREQVGITFGIASGNSLSLGPYNAGSSRWSLVLDLWAVKDGAISEHFTHEFVYFSGA